MIVNHVGLRVTDIEASTAFYVGLGFTQALAMDVPDEPMCRLVRVTPPADLRAAYLTNGTFVLELLTFGADQPARRDERVMTDVGLTHLSLGVDDLVAAKELVVAHGGEVLDDTDVGVAVMVRDPDGQLLELLDVDYRPVVPERD